MFTIKLKRKTIIAGHYGSGKTEFCVSLAMLLSGGSASKTSDNIYQQPGRAGQPMQKTALIDLDIVNPYFRSRQCRDLLASAGISVYGSVYDGEVTAEIPELGATVRVPLEDKNTKTIIDLGGNDSGAIVIKQFLKYFKDDDTLTAMVVNANRPETLTADDILNHIKAIEQATGLAVSHIINNTHLIRETTPGDIIKGNKLCNEVCTITSKTLLCNCYPEGIVEPCELSELDEPLMPMGLYMRPAWLDL